MNAEVFNQEWEGSETDFFFMAFTQMDFAFWCILARPATMYEVGRTLRSVQTGALVSISRKRFQTTTGSWTCCQKGIVRRDPDLAIRIQTWKQLCAGKTFKSPAICRPGPATGTGKGRRKNWLSFWLLPQVRWLCDSCPKPLNEMLGVYSEVPAFGC